MRSYKDYMIEKRRKNILAFSIFSLCLVTASIFVQFDAIHFLFGLPAMGDLFFRIFSPNFSYLGKVFDALLETIEIAVIASVLGMAVSLPLAMLMSRNAGFHKVIPAVLSAFFSLLRTVPSLIWAAFLVSMFSVGKFSGIAATFIIATLMGTRLLREHIDSITENQIFSVRSTGASNYQILLYCILPNTIPHLISVFFIVLESCMRSATILGLVGAGGIGQIMWKDLNMFRYDNVATVILIMFLSIYAMDFLSLKVRTHIGGTFFPPRSLKEFRIKKLSGKLGFILVFAVGAVLLFHSLQVSGERFELGLNQGGYILRNLLTPDFSYSYKLKEGLSESFAIAVFATMVGALFSFVAVRFSAYNISRNRAVSWTLKVVTNALRTFPPVVTAIIFFRGVGPGPFAGALALSVYTTGVMTKLYGETVESLPQNIIDSLKTTGASATQTYVRGIFPESSASFYSLLLYRMESNIRNSTILGLVGAGGIGTALNMNIQWRNWNRVGLLLLGSGIMIIFFDILSRYLRKKLTT